MAQAVSCIDKPNRIAINQRGKLFYVNSIVETKKQQNRPTSVICNKKN